jgi:two-component system, chemotaxis family, CheB/CheR fusion protein
MSAKKKEKSLKKKQEPNFKKGKIKVKPTKEKAVFQMEGKGFPIVGIGASAGGLEALEGFFSHVPPEPNMAFVVIQHLAPKHKSVMDSLLKRRTQMDVVVAEDGRKIEPNCVYLNPPDKDVAIMDGTLHLMEPVQRQGIRLPIDYFFRSLAQDQREKAICIVLSGTATDGTLGVKAIKGEGGMVMAQEEKQAQYDSMPKSAIDTGLVDFILPVEKMSEELMRYAKHPYIKAPEKITAAEEKFETTLSKIFLAVRAATGHDFSNYKQSTTRRRIQRRMAVHQIEDITDYLRYLQKNPAEVGILDKDLYIRVTNFFRDSDAFDALNQKVILSLLKEKQPEASLRIWVPGCASGEEAYSIAIMFTEAMEMLKKHFDIQIFASDIDAESIERARGAVYPESIAADVSDGRLRHFFKKEGNAYKLKKQIREMVVFAVQNLIKDPPFSKLELVSCRNLLIYMDSELQKKILPLFYYTLNKDGFMFLGPSESIGGFADLFAPVDTKWKIFKRKTPAVEKVAGYVPPPFYEAAFGRIRAEAGEGVAEAKIRQLAEKIILEHYAPSCVLIDEKYNILYFHGKTDTFLSPPTGEPSFNILNMIRDDLRYRLGATLHQAIKQKKTAVSEGLQIKRDDGLLTVDIQVRPLMKPEAMQGLIMVTFETKKPPEKRDKKKKVPEGLEEGKVDGRVTSLEQELQSTKQYLQTTVEELEASNEELKSTNEELQSTNEELQSSNEELETSKEELQSTNEELGTVNAELQGKIDELSRANDDLNNLFASTEVGTIFLDTELRIKSFTPSASKIFNLIKTDIGRSISDLSPKITYEDIHKDAQQVLKTLSQKETEIQTAEGEWFSMRLLPYRTVENVIDGVVITFVDINKIKKAESEQGRLVEDLKKANEAIKTLYTEREKKDKGLKKL